MSSETERKSTRGFASMSPERHREVASRGGRTAQARGTGHRFTSVEAQIAGSKGGKVVSQDREHMSKIARKRASLVATKAAEGAESTPAE